MNKGICLEISKLTDTVCLRHLFVHIKTQINVPDASTKLRQDWDAWTQAFSTMWNVWEYPQELHRDGRNDKGTVGYPKWPKTNLNTCVLMAKCHLWSVIQSYIETPDCRYLYVRAFKHLQRGSWRSPRIFILVPGIWSGTSTGFVWAPSTVGEYPVSTATGIQTIVQLIPGWTPTSDCLDCSRDCIDSDVSILLTLEMNEEGCFWSKIVNNVVVTPL